MGRSLNVVLVRPEPPSQAPDGGAARRRSRRRPGRCAGPPGSPRPTCSSPPTRSRGRRGLAGDVGAHAPSRTGATSSSSGRRRPWRAWRAQAVRVARLLPGARRRERARQAPGAPGAAAGAAGAGDRRAPTSTWGRCAPSGRTGSRWPRRLARRAGGRPAERARLAAARPVVAAARRGLPHGAGLLPRLARGVPDGGAGQPARLDDLAQQSAVARPACCGRRAPSGGCSGPGLTGSGLCAPWRRTAVSRRAGSEGHRRRGGGDTPPFWRIDFARDLHGRSACRRAVGHAGIGGVTLTKIAVGEMHNNAYLLSTRPGRGCSSTRPPSRSGCSDHRRHAGRQDRDHAPAPRPLAGARRGEGRDRRRHRGAPADAPGIPVPTDELVEDGGTIAFGDTVLAYPPGRAHARVDRADPGRGRGRPHLFTGDCLFPGGVGNTQKDPARSTRCTPASRQGLRPAARCDLDLPRPRQRHHARRGAPAPGGMARPGLVRMTRARQAASRGFCSGRPSSA